MFSTRTQYHTYILREILIPSTISYLMFVYDEILLFQKIFDLKIFVLHLKFLLYFSISLYLINIFGKYFCIIFTLFLFYSNTFFLAYKFIYTYINFNFFCLKLLQLFWLFTFSSLLFSSLSLFCLKEILLFLFVNNCVPLFVKRVV